MRLGRGPQEGSCLGCGSSEDREGHQMSEAGETSQLPTWQAAMRDFISTLKIGRWYGPICVVKGLSAAGGWGEWPGVLWW